MNIGSLFPAFQTVKPEARSEATSAREERRQALADARLNDARAAVESLKQRTSNASEEKKAAARKKIEEIKAWLQMLQMAMIGDPKGAARMAAALARELGAAVKAYAAAGGSTASLGAASDTTMTGGADVATDTTSGEAQVEAADAGQPIPSEDRGAEISRSSNPYQQAIEASQSRIAEQARRSGELQADRDLLGEVRGLAARIKAMAERASKGSPEGEEADRAVAGMEREVQAAVQAMPSVGLLVRV